MNTDEQIIAVQQLDPVEAGRIIRQLGNIAPDFHLASGPISDRLMSEIVRTFTRAADEPWVASEANGTAILMAPEWKMTKGVGGIGDAWLELSEITTDECDHSWLEAALKTGGTLMCVELKFRPGLNNAAEKTIRDDKAVAGFFELSGWTRDEQEARLVQPVDLKTELVAQAFEMNDFDEALEPVSQAVTAAIAAKADLDALINRIRDEAKKK